MIDDARTLFLLEMAHWCCCCRCNCRCFSAPRQWKLFSSSCLLVERPHEEHVRNLSACTRLTAKAFLSVSLWLIDLVIVIATVDISTRTLGKKNSVCSDSSPTLAQAETIRIHATIQTQRQTNSCPEQSAHAQKSCHHPAHKESKRRIHWCHVGIPRHSHPHESPRDLIFCVHIFYLYYIKRTWQGNLCVMGHYMRSHIHTLLLPGTLYEVLHTHFTAAILEVLSRCILLPCHLLLQRGDLKFVNTQIECYAPSPIYVKWNVPYPEFVNTQINVMPTILSTQNFFNINNWMLCPLCSPPRVC